MENESSYLPIEAMDLGYDFEQEVTRLVESVSYKIKRTCFQYLKTLLLQMLKRFPPNMGYFKTYKIFLPNICCNSVGQPNFNSIREFLQPVLNTSVSMDIYESQWRKMQFIIWKEVFVIECATDLSTF